MPKHTVAEVTNALQACLTLTTPMEIQNGPLRSYSYLIPLYHLVYRHHNDEWIYLTAPVFEEAYTTAAEARYWYRSMTPSEFETLNRNNRFHGDSYGGIATHRQYVRQYFTNNSEGTHLVEFTTPSAGFLFQQLTPIGQIKAEGGGTFGLGPTGTGAGKAGAAFNSLLAKRQITWELVDLRISNRLA
jgi:hypothetical protein